MPDIFVDQKQIPQQQSQGLERVQFRPLKKIEKSSDVGILSSFVRDPKGIAIAEQHADEKIILFIRRNVITNLPWLISGLIFIIFPFFLPTLISPINILSNYLSTTAIILLSLFYYLVVFGFMFANFVTWFYDIGIVTEERSVDIDFYNISYVSVATARAQDLKDVRYFQRGIFESLFDYGDVTMAVESSNETLTFEKSPHPAEVVTLISGLIGGHQKRGI